MKTRIISGIVMGLIVASVLTVGFLWAPFIISVALGLLAGAAVYELLHNAADIKNKYAVFGAVAYAFIGVVVGYFNFYAVVIATVLYGIFAAIMILINHKDFDFGKISAMYALPLPYTMAFYLLFGIINHSNGIYYLLLLLNFSCVCDMGAYFTGVTVGKHKLCPEISPNKTVEGAIGGIISSMIFSVVISLLFNKFSLAVILLTVPFCIIGMIGDLFASVIKRSVGLKDYSNLIPGHGGIMDRFDSIIMIAPFMFVTLLCDIL